MISYKLQPFLFDDALEAFEVGKGIEALNQLYATIPSGRCDSCGACCYDNVPLSVGEFLALVSYLKSEGRLERAVEKVARWYVYQFETVQPCVFLGDDKRCEVYAVRPLVCRLFGHQTADEQARRVKIVLEQNQKLAAAVKDAYGIVIKPEVVKHAIQQCGFVPDEVFEKSSQDSLFDAVQQLDLPYYQQGLVDLEYINLSLVEWFVLAFLDEDELLDQTIAANRAK